MEQVIYLEVGGVATAKQKRYYKTGQLYYKVGQGLQFRAVIDQRYIKELVRKIALLPYSIPPIYLLGKRINGGT